MTFDEKQHINEILNNIRDGNSEAFDELYNLMYNVIFCFLKRYSRNFEMIKDLISSTFMVVIDKISNRENIKNGYNLILTIAKNTLLNKIRETKKEVAIDENIQIDTLNIENMTLNFALKTALNKLSEQNQHILYLKFAEKATLYEIAKYTKLSIATVKRRIKESINILREEL